MMSCKKRKDKEKKNSNKKENKKKNILYYTLQNAQKNIYDGTRTK